MVAAAVVLAAASLVQGGMNAAAKQKAKKFTAEAARMQIQNLQDKIDLERIVASRKERQTQGSGVVAAGAVGVQFSGSVRTATNQAVQDQEFEKLVKVADLKYQQRLQQLRAASGINELGQAQTGDVIGALGKAGKNYYEISTAEKTNAELDTPAETGATQ